jgi:hypothetical protein
MQRKVSRDGSHEGISLAIAIALSVTACGGGLSQASKPRDAAPVRCGLLRCSRGHLGERCTLAGSRGIIVQISATALGCDTGGPVKLHEPKAPLSHAGITCTFGANGADVETQITDQAECGPDRSALATFGLNWYPISRFSAAGSKGIADGETMTLTCILDKGPSVMTVMDAGGAYYGNQVCSAEEQHGWTSP